MLEEGNVLFNDALHTFYLRLYGVGHMVKDHSYNERTPAAINTYATFIVWGRGEGEGRFTCPDPLKVQACPTQARITPQIKSF